MGTAICMNKLCRVTSTPEWKSGWPLRSGGFATLCFVCGSAFENFVYCETFHREESGWRECESCKKLIHCGCTSSRHLIELLDLGGACCITCVKKSGQHSIRRDDVSNGYTTQVLSNIGGLQHHMADSRINEDSAGKATNYQLGKIKMDGESNLLSQSQKGEAHLSLGTINGEEVILPTYGELSSTFWNLNPHGSPHFPVARSNIPLGVPDGYETAPPTLLNIGLSTPSDNSSFSAKYSSGALEGRDSIALPSPSQLSQRSRAILPKPSKSGLSLSIDASKGVAHPPRVARPPAEGRGRNQLLPRYWPRITDQELQQLSGDLNSPVVPLFEKVLSASDAGRIGRLVLPKACAEAYFPPISQSEGTPIKIQDAKGKEWTFQFRFWPNNNSRMYVLEGVTPCIQSMQCQAGDTVIFSRRDPGGKLVIGSRKASASSDTQDGDIPALTNGGESSFSGISAASGYSGTFQSMTENHNAHPHALSEQMAVADSNAGWSKGDRNRARFIETPVGPPRRPKNITSKSRRLLMHNEDVMELKLTWDEAQELLRAPPSIKPSVVTVEDQEIEEYEEPPVLAKKTIFTVSSSGGQEQWAQCDMCYKWRRLPIDVILPLRWTCADNFWDSNRGSCSMPDEVGAKELENLMNVGKDLKRRRTSENHKAVHDHEPTGLDALASAAILGDNAAGDSGETSVGITTKHPRHRPGCTCIVCIQPPSGKGKHNPTCTCNVCMTVKRRFKTLMLRKRIRQSEREAEVSQRDLIPPIENHESTNYKGNSAQEMIQSQPVEAEADTDTTKMTQNNIVQVDQVSDNSDGQLDLNSHPDRINDHMEQEMSAAVSMTTLVHAAALPLENYLQQNGLATLRSDPSVPPQLTEQTETVAVDNVDSTAAESETIPASDDKDDSKSVQANHDEVVDVDDKS